MAADQTRVLTRLIEILNLTNPGGYAASLNVRNKTRNLTALTDTVIEAGLMICKAIAERPNEFRQPFLEDHEITDSGELLPVHIGPPASVKITLGGDVVREGKRLDYRKIESYRENPNQIYDEIAHDEEGSSLGGLYDLWNDRFFFTGASATVSLARQPVRGDTSLIPLVFEPTWVALSIGNANKVGTGGYETAIINAYAARGQQDLQDFIGGRTQFDEIADPQPISAVHTA
jgi:hypothetical protein